MKTLEPGRGGESREAWKGGRPTTAMRKTSQRSDFADRPMSAATRRRYRIVMRRRKTAFSAFLFAALTGLLGFYLLESDALKIKYVEIEGIERIADREIYDKTRKLIGLNLALAGTGELQKEIAANPQVASVRVRRAFPSRLKVTIEERVPFAYVTDQSAWYLIDGNMVVMGIEKQPREQGFLQIQCERAQNPRPGAVIAFPLSDRLPELSRAAGERFKGQVARLDFRRSGIVLHFKSGVYVLLGRGDELEEKLELIPVILQELNRNDKEFVGLNLIRLKTPSYIIKEN